MNEDFSELENELKKLRPARPSPVLFESIERALSENAAQEKIVRPDRFRANWAALGFGLAAAAVFLIFAYVSFERRQEVEIVRTSPASKPGPALGEIQRPRLVNEYIPADATQVVYNTRDEGLQFPSGSTQPLRRLRYQTHQTLQWRNAATGASLRVSYPSEETVLIPVSGQ